MGNSYQILKTKAIILLDFSVNPWNSLAIMLHVMLPIWVECTLWTVNDGWHTDWPISKPLVCAQIYVCARVRVQQFLFEWVRKNLKICACGCVRETFLGADMRQTPHIVLIFYHFSSKKKCATHYQNVCNVHAGAAKNPRTLTVCGH